MNRYITVHKLKTDVQEFAEFFNGVAMDFAKATSSGAQPARCLTTWNGAAHAEAGQERVFCLWEAEKPEDIETSLGDVMNYVTLEPHQVDEIVWAELAQAG